MSREKPSQADARFRRVPGCKSVSPVGPGGVSLRCSLSLGHAGIGSEGDKHFCEGISWTDAEASASVCEYRDVRILDVVAVNETVDDYMLRELERKREFERGFEPLTPADLDEQGIGLGDFDGGDDA